MHKQHMNIEKFSNIKDFMLLLTVNTWPSRLSLHFRNHLWLHFNFVKFVALKCYVLHFESRRAAASPASVCPLWVRGCDGLMVTLLTLLSLHWEAAGQRGWAALDCISVSPCLRVTLSSPRPVTGVNDQDHPLRPFISDASQTVSQISPLNLPFFFHGLLAFNLGW